MGQALVAPTYKRIEVVLPVIVVEVRRANELATDESMGEQLHADDGEPWLSLPMHVLLQPVHVVYQVDSPEHRSAA